MITLMDTPSETETRPALDIIALLREHQGRIERPICAAALNLCELNLYERGTELNFAGQDRCFERIHYLGIKARAG